MTTKMDNKDKLDHITNGGNGYSIKEMLQIHMKSSVEFRREVLTKIDSKVSKDMFWKVLGTCGALIGTSIAVIIKII